MKDSFLTFLLFIAVCACIYCAVLTFFSFISGWMILSRVFPAGEADQPDTVLLSSQSVKMGLMDYPMMVKIRFTETGIIFSMQRIFSFMHRPFMAPYDKISELKEVDSSDQDIIFIVNGIKIKLTGESADILKKKSKNPQLPVVSFRTPGIDESAVIKKGSYLRSTRERKFNELQYQFISAVRDFVEGKKVNDFENTISHCFETTTTSRGFFGIKLQQYTDMVITKEWFFWGVCDGDGCSTGCAKIKDLAKILDIEKILLSDSIEINGIDITGFHYDESRLNSWTIYTGKDEAGVVFRRKLRDAVRTSSR